MREIKFRAWLTLSDYDDDGNDKDYHAMINDVSVSSGGYVGFSVDQGHAAFGGDIFERALENGNAYEYEEWCSWDGHYNLMQYTGLKDRHGVEIYEGDIIQGGTRLADEVIFRDGLFQTAGGYRVIYTDSVIGNIYENPELLEVKL